MLLDKQSPRVYLIKALLLTVLVLGLHFVAAWFGWYGVFSQLDTVLHFMGGVTVGCFWLWLIARSRAQREKEIPAWLVITSLIGTVLSVGLLWEIFEYALWLATPLVADSYEFLSPTVSDVLMDLCADVFGGLVVGCGILSVSKKKDT